MAGKQEITPTLTNCTITDPAKDTDGKFYFTKDTKSITLKADENCVFDTDGTFTYQGEYGELTDPIKANNSDTLTYTFPDFDFYDQYTPITVTMTATKKQVTPPTPDPEKPTPNPEPTEPNAPKPDNPTTPLEILKNSLRIPLDLTEDDSLLQGYLDSATEYLRSMLDKDVADEKLKSKIAQVAIVELATLYYQQRGEDVTAKDWPFSLRVLINSLRFN